MFHLSLQITERNLTLPPDSPQFPFPSAVNVAVGAGGWHTCGSFTNSRVQIPASQWVTFTRDIRNSSVTITRKLPFHRNAGSTSIIDRGSANLVLRAARALLAPSDHTALCFFHCQGSWQPRVTMRHPGRM